MELVQPMYRLDTIAKNRESPLHFPSFQQLIPVLLQISSHFQHIFMLQMPWMGTKVVALRLLHVVQENLLSLRNSLLLFDHIYPVYFVQGCHFFYLVCLLSVPCSEPQHRRKDVTMTFRTQNCIQEPHKLLMSPKLNGLLCYSRRYFSLPLL